MPASHLEDSDQLQILGGAFDALGSPVAILDEHGLILVVNRAWSRFAENNGGDPARVGPGASYLQVCQQCSGPDAEIARRATQAIRDILAGSRRTVSMVYPCHSPDQERWFELTGSRIDDAGRARALIVHRDITLAIESEQVERKLAYEEAARALAETARKQLETVFESITEGFVSFDRSWRFTYANHITEEFLGRPRREILGRRIYDLWPEFADMETSDLLLRAAEGQHPLVEEHCVNGRWLRVAANPSPEGVAVYFQDVTEQRRSQAALRESERLLDEVFEVLPVGVWITDTSGTIVRGNAAGQRIWEGARYVGVDRYHEYRGWWVDTGDPIAGEDWALARAVRHGETSLGELVRIQCFDGSFKTILNSAVPLYDDDRELLGAIVVNEDVTELRATEEALRSALRGRDEVLGMVSHDLRQPITTIAVAARMLLHLPAAGDHSQLRTIADTILRGSRTLQRLTADLLDVATLTDGNLSLRRELGRIEEVVVEAADSIRAQAQAAGIRVEASVDDALPPLYIDQDRLRQVFSNLCANALRFTPSGGRISLRATRGRREVVCAVEDTGTGIPEDQLDNIFNRYWQATPGEGGGRGLGLSIARAIVEAHGGHIWAESTPGRGTVFSFSIPVAPGGP